MDATQLSSLLINLPAAVRAQQETFERWRLELSSYDEMRERGQTPEKMAMLTRKGLPGEVARFLELMDRDGQIDMLLKKSTDEIAQFVLNTMLTTMAYSCVALEIYTNRLITAGNEIDEAIRKAGEQGWLDENLPSTDLS